MTLVASPADPPTHPPNPSTPFKPTGYLPCFWVKLRNLALPAAPDLQLPALASLLPQPTVGFVVTVITVACIIAADTGAYFVGKSLGRTKLTDISPKKTVEGAVGGLACSVAISLALHSVFGWPGSALAAAGYGLLTFATSIFGDLIESIIKRDAGMKVGAALGGARTWALVVHAAAAGLLRVLVLLGWRVRADPSTNPPKLICNSRCSTPTTPIHPTRTLAT